MEQRVWHRHYDDGVPVRIDYERIPIPTYLERAAESYPDRTALVFLNARLSYRELLRAVRRMAAAMAGLGVKPGSAVGIQLPNMPQNVIAYYAALSLGARVVMTNPLYTPREIAHQWKDAGCVLAVTTDFIYDQRVRAMRSDLPVENVIVASIPEYLRFPLNWLAPLKLKRQDPPMYVKLGREPGLHRFRELVERTDAEPALPEIAWDDIAVLQYTGGTTGVSKAAVLSHANLSSNVQQISAWFTGLERGGEVILTSLPLFHVFGMTVAMNWAIESGATMVLLPNPRDTATMVKNIAKHRVTVFPGVPAMFNALNCHPGIEQLDVSSVKSCFSGSAPIPLDVLEKFERLTGARIVEGFGLSETSPVTHVSPLRGVRKVGKVGIPMSDTDARIVDVEEGTKVLGPGEEGELCLRGPQVMRGYWKRDDETAKTLRDGWLFTGDLAVMDEDGYFQIVGRKKDMINVGGLKVFPDEVDAVLMAHDKILEAATIGVPHERRGETVKSFIVLQPGETLTPEEIDAYSRECLAPYKVPREIEFLDELPKSTVLKVLRRELRDRELAKRGGD